MDQKKLWLKISSSINFYLQGYDKSQSAEELLKGYLEDVLPDDLYDDGIRRYLDKQSFEYVEVSKEIEEKAKKAFIERLNKRMSREELIENKKDH